MKERITNVYNQKVKIYAWLNGQGKLEIKEIKLKDIVPKGHKVFLRFDDNDICVECFDLTLMFGENVPNKNIKKVFSELQYKPYKEN